ncbi:carbon storage regulator [Desulfofundulus thermocisternus]|uniref:carbon storage regulator n=1 Tax=Desulfofundulus thermocisternus TaxID=42471 RepID=UPI000A8D88B2|nr:carbon storage regulator [Desulfofundulus thermocisternus]
MNAAESREAETGARDGGGKVLVLTRKEEEAFIIDGRVKVVILQIEGNQVSVGIEAPKDVHIVRAELVEKDREQQEETT